MILSIMPFSIMKLSIQGLNVTLSINDIQHKNTAIMLSDIMPSAIMLSVVMLKDGLLSVVAPSKKSSPETNALAYLLLALATNKKFFIILPPGVRWVHRTHC